MNILAIERQGRFATEVLRPSGSTELAVGDIVLLDIRASAERMAAWKDEYRVEALPLEEGDYFLDRSQEIGMVEAIIPPELAADRQYRAAGAGAGGIPA